MVYKTWKYERPPAHIRSWDAGETPEICGVFLPPMRAENRHRDRLGSRTRPQGGDISGKAESGNAKEGSRPESLSRSLPDGDKEYLLPYNGCGLLFMEYQIEVQQHMHMVWAKVMGI